MRIILFGGAGSLGKAFAKLLHKEHEVVVWDSNEWAIAEMKDALPNIKYVLDDYANWKYPEEPADLVVILSAYKHINLGEEHPVSFVNNNIVSLIHVLKESQYGNADILFISTDKAVEPISLYGYTKAIGEAITKHYEGSIARLPNILSSSGSVIPVWEHAIRENQPIKITDERMMRYVIEDYDAVNRIWHSFLEGEKLIVPYCEERRLLDILGDVLKKYGYKKASDYKPGVEVIGMRPGEKLRERLRWDDENTEY